jgi:hypothetical protein
MAQRQYYTTFRILVVVLGGYRTNLTEQQLKGAPKYTGNSWDWDDRERGRKVYEYYGTPWSAY